MESQIEHWDKAAMGWINHIKRVLRHGSVILFVTLFLGVGHTSPRSLKQGVLVAPIALNGDKILNQAAVDDLTSKITSILMQSGRFSVVKDWGAIKQDEEIQKMKEACSSVECAMKGAEMLEVELGVTTTLNCRNESCSLVMTLIDSTVSGGKPIKSVRRENIPNRSGEIENMISTSSWALLIEEQNAIGTGEKRKVSFKSVPPGAEITIDGEPIGRTDKIVEVSVGSHDVFLQHPSGNYNPISEPLLVEAGNVDNVQEKTWKFGQAMATVKFTVSPPNAKLMLNGKWVNFLGVEKLPVPAGQSLKFEFTAEKFETLVIRKEATDIKAGLTVDLGNIQLTPKPGQLGLQGSPTGATVFVNGSYIGRLPMTLDLPTTLEGIDYRIEIRNDEYDQYSETVRVYPDTKRIVTALLKKACFSEEEKQLIKTRGALRTAGWIGFGVAGGLAIGSGYFLSKMQSDYEEYQSASTPAAADKAWQSVASSQSTFLTLGISSVATAGLGYLLYRLGDYPEELKIRERSCGSMGGVGITGDGLYLTSSLCF